MEDQLHGSWGKKVYEIDAAGSIVGEDVDQDVDPVAGQDIQLTIDLDVQQYAEQALETKLRNSQNLPTDIRGQDIAAAQPGRPDDELQVRVSSPARRSAAPGVDPVQGAGRFGRGRGQLQHGPDHGHGQLPDVRQPLAGVRASARRSTNRCSPRADDPDKSILVNRADPGPVQHGFVDQAVRRLVGDGRRDHHADDSYIDQGIYTLESIDPKILPEHRRPCAASSRTPRNAAPDKPSAYGPLSVQTRWRSAATRSSTGSARSSIDGRHRRPDKSYMKSFLQPFGFGTETGIQLPFECSGRVPDTPIKQELIATGKFGKNEVPQLVVGDDVQVAIGQGLMAATPLQAANAYSTLANGGSPAAAEHRQGDLRAADAELADAGGGRPRPRARSCSRSTRRRSPTRCSSTRTPTTRSSPGLQARGLRPQGVNYPSSFYHATTGEDLFGGLRAACRSPARPARRRAPAATRGTTRRRSARSAPTAPGRTRWYAYLEKCGLRREGGGPGRQVHLHRAVRPDAHGRGADQRSARHQLATRWPRRSTCRTRRASAPAASTD